MTDAKDKLDKAKIEVVIAQRNGQFEKAGQLQYGEIPNLEKNKGIGNNCRGTKK